MATYKNNNMQYIENNNNQQRSNDLEEALALIRVMFQDRDRYVQETEEKNQRLIHENQSLVEKLREYEKQIQFLQKENQLNTSPENSIHKKQSTYKTYSEVMDGIADSNKKTRKSLAKTDPKNESLQHSETTGDNKNNLVEADILINTYNTGRSQNPGFQQVKIPYKDNKQIPNSYMYTNESNGDTIGSPFKPIKNMIPQGQNYRGAFNFSNYETNNGKEGKVPKFEPESQYPKDEIKSENVIANENQYIYSPKTTSNKDYYSNNTDNSSRTEVKDFLSTVRDKISSRDFKDFIKYIKVLTDKSSNANRVEIFSNVKVIFGDKYKDLYERFEKLLSNKR